MPPMARAAQTALPVAPPAPAAQARARQPSNSTTASTTTSTTTPTADCIPKQYALSHPANLRHPGSAHSSSNPAPSGHDSVISTPGSPKQPYSQSACSNSNTSRDARQSLAHDLPVADDDEKTSLSQPAPVAMSNTLARPSRDMALDLEKQCYSPTRNSRQSNRNHLPVTATSEDAYPPADATDAELEDKALKILLHLSGFIGIVSFAISLWTLLAVVLAALLQPLRFCSMRPDYREQIVKFLGPSLRLQFRLIYSAPLSSMYNTPLLFLVCLLSPFVAIGVAIAAWISAFFWIYAAIIGDPGSKDCHNDGRESVLVVRSYWESWLLRALR